MKSLTRNEVAEFLLTHDNYLILTHRRPDGDTIGSSAALCRILRGLGKTAHILRNPEVTPRYAWLHEGLTRETPEAGDTLITVDVASVRMLPDGWVDLGRTAALRIDHHASAESFTEAELVDPGAGACGEIIYDILMELWQELKADVAEALYVATSTDTGCFRFANTTHHSFLVAAACAAAGAPVFRLNQELFDTVTLGRLKIQAWIVEHMQLMKEGTLAVVAIPKAVEEQLQVTEDDMDNISAFPRSIAGVKMAATLRETGDGKTKISVRAVPGLDATVVAGIFGGGGHKGAAGASTSMPLTEAAAAIAEAMMAL